MRLLVCGQRDWTNRALIKRAIKRLEPEILIHGAQRGADTIAGEVAKELGIEVWEFPADWDAYGKRAGVLRNQEMLDKGKPNMVLAFYTNRDTSKGTTDMIGRALKAKLPCRAFEIGKGWVSYNC